MSIRGLELTLLRCLNSTQVYPDGRVIEIKQLVRRINGLKIEIYSKEHNPPHFHVVTNCQTIDASFSLSDCTLLKGEIDKSNYKRIKYFFDRNKEELLKVWKEKNAHL